MGFALGIMAHLGLDRHPEHARCLRPRSPGSTTGPILAIALLLFCGAVGKSAQFPLHVWLPDAMEGPTPVSALIHAATMVNAGVYLVARANPIFSLVPEAMVVVAAIGIFTAILAASIAFTQTDIKRVLAYSTLSQLGYMFAALGVGAYAAAIFHLMAHGFFKGLLFLGSGSVIHAVHDEQDMNKMGGLWRKIPITHWTMLIGTIAIAGIPPLAGFFSKDEILGEAYKLNFGWVWAIGVLVAGMTAFYMCRLMGKTFYGQSHVDPAVEPTIHESTWTMTLPLILLAIPAMLLGLWLGLPFGDSLLTQWLHPVFAGAEETLGQSTQPFALFGIDGALILISVGVATIGLVAGMWLFGFFRRNGRRATVEAIAASSGATRFLYRASLNKWWFDDLNHLLFIVIGGRVANALWWFDRNVVDGTVNGGGEDHHGCGDRAAPDPDGPGPELRARHRHRPDHHGRLLPRDRGAVGGRHGHLLLPDPEPDHLPAPRRGGRGRVHPPAQPRRHPSDRARSSRWRPGWSACGWSWASCRAATWSHRRRAPSSTWRSPTGSRSSGSSTRSAWTGSRWRWWCSPPPCRGSPSWPASRRSRSG